MFTRLRKAKDYIADSFFGHTFLPAILSGGETLASSGGALFGTQEFLKYAAVDINSPLSITLQVATLASSIVINMVVRVPLIFKRCRRQTMDDEILLPETLPSEEPTHLTLEEENKPDEHLNCFYKSVVLTYKGITILSGIFASLNSYLGTFTIASFIGEKVFSNNNIRNEPWQEALLQISAIIVFSSTLISYLTYNGKKISANIENIAFSLQNKSYEMNWQKISSFSLSSFGLMSIPFIAFFTTSNSLAKMKFVTIPDFLLKSISMTASFARFSTELVSSPVSICKFLEKKNLNEQMNNTCYEMATANLAMVCGGFDSAGEGLRFYISVIDTFGKFQLNTNHPAAMVFATFCGLSGVASNLFFGVYEGVVDYLKDRSKPIKEDYALELVTGPLEKFYSKKPPFTLYQQNNPNFDSTQTIQLDNIHISPSN